jgi:DNA-binding response OmpR family regulator
MSKKVIVLADNSYTIRRIVELSFSEIENIEIRSFENGSAIKEKLLQLNPAVVIVDIKLPELNGYDVCRFINETPALGRTRVFLMKGSFEPVDNEMIKNLKYEDIITKPFDSNALVSSVMKIVNQDQQGGAAESADEGPATFPEDFPEIETDAPESEDISFSDIRGEMEAPLAAERPLPGSQGLERDEILPSEEITQGTQPLKDNLIPQETEEALKNPFEEEPAFEEINMASAAAAGSVPLDYEKDPLFRPPAAGQVKDASDEFHERFLEIANEDTSEDLLKPSLGAPPLAASDNLQFPASLKNEKLPDSEDKFSLEFEKTDMGSPAQTLYAGADSMADFMTAGPKPEKAKDGVPPASKIVEKERPLEKARLESLSLQDELAKLAVTPKKEPKVEAKADPGQPQPEKFELTGKLEEKLSLTIKELLWEIVPPMAEKIIKEEIDKIKSELNKDSL